MKILGAVVSLILVSLLIIFQISAVGTAAFFSVGPNLLFILIFAAFWTVGVKPSLYLAFFGGLYYDVLSLGALGVTPLFFLGLLFALSLLRKFISGSFSFFVFYFYLAGVLYRFLSFSLTFRIGFLALGVLDLLILFLLTAVLRFLLSVWNPPRVLQLKFQKLT